MSYILEALKKSKQERQEGTTPHLHIVHGGPSFKPRSFKFGWIAAVAGGLGLILGLGGLIFSFFSEKKLPEGIDSAKSITVRNIEIRSQFIEQPEEAVVVQDSQYISRLPVVTEDSPQILLIAKDKTKTVFLDSSQNNEPAPSEEFPTLINRTELPRDLQNEIPQFVFAGHTYADDPQQRMIIINNAILREGDSIDANTKLLNIVWEGVVLEYKGVIFKQKIR